MKERKKMTVKKQEIFVNTDLKIMIDLDEGNKELSVSSINYEEINYFNKVLVIYS